jgi:hypothetical protein
LLIINQKWDSTKVIQSCIIRIKLFSFKSTSEVESYVLVQGTNGDIVVYLMFNYSSSGVPVLLVGGIQGLENFEVI